MDELKDKGKKVMSEVKGDIITKWEEKSRDFIETFLLLFGRERLTNIWDKSKGRIMQALSPTGSPNGSINGDEESRDFDPDDDDDDDDNNYFNGLEAVQASLKQPHRSYTMGEPHRSAELMGESSDEERRSH